MQLACVQVHVCGLYAVRSHTNWMCVKRVQLVCVQVHVCGLYAVRSHNQLDVCGTSAVGMRASTRVWLVCSLLIYQLNVCGRRATDMCAGYMRVAYMYDSRIARFSWHACPAHKYPLHTCSTHCCMCAAYVLHLYISVRDRSYLLLQGLGYDVPTQWDVFTQLASGYVRWVQ